MVQITNYGNFQSPATVYNKNPASLYANKQKSIPLKSLPFVGNGVNLQPSYYNGGNVDLGWNIMKKYSVIQTVRIEIEPNQVTNAKRWIKEAVGYGYKVIATYHKYNAPLGTDNDAELQAAANWWKTNYKVLNASGSFIINLMNEWGSHNISSNDYANSYNKAINTVRSVYNGPIIIDIPGYGQETKTASDAVKGTNGGKIGDPNIILSTHIYNTAWNQGRNRFLLKQDLDELASCGRKCIVGEFGDAKKASGKADWSALVDYAKSNPRCWPVIGWAWNGDGSNPVPMNMITPQFQPFVKSKPFKYTQTNYLKTIISKL